MQALVKARPDRGDDAASCSAEIHQADAEEASGRSRYGRTYPPLESRLRRMVAACHRTRNKPLR